MSRHGSMLATEIVTSNRPHAETNGNLGGAPLSRGGFGASVKRDRRYSRDLLDAALTERRSADAQAIADAARLRAEFHRVMSAGAITPAVPEV